MNWLHTVLILVAAFLAVFGKPLSAACDTCWAHRSICCPRSWSMPLVRRHDDHHIAGRPRRALVRLTFGEPAGCERASAVCRWAGDPPEARPDLAGSDLRAVVLGGAASAVVPVLTLLLLLTTGHTPLLGWGTLWQLGS